MGFDRNHLPDPASYFESKGQKVVGNRGNRFRTNCTIHGGDGLNVSVLRDSGAWFCFKCHAGGGDVLSYEMQDTGIDFVRGAKSLGAWIEDGRTTFNKKPPPLPAREAIRILNLETHLIGIEGTRMASGQLPSDDDLDRFQLAVARVLTITKEFV